MRVKLRLCFRQNAGKERWCAVPDYCHRKFFYSFICTLVSQTCLNENNGRFEEEFTLSKLKVAKPFVERYRMILISCSLVKKAESIRCQEAHTAISRITQNLEHPAVLHLPYQQHSTPLNSIEPPLYRILRTDLCSDHTFAIILMRRIREKYNYLSW